MDGTHKTCVWNALRRRCITDIAAIAATQPFCIRFPKMDLSSLFWWHFHHWLHWKSQITSLTIVYSTVCSGAEQSKHQSSASMAFVWGIHRWPVNSPHKWPVTRKMYPFDDVIMNKNYAHDKHFCAFCSGHIIVDFTDIYEGFFTDIKTIIRLSWYQWNNLVWFR